MKNQLPNRPLVTGKGMASEVDLGDSDKANRRKPQRPSEKAAIIENGGARSGECPANFDSVPLKYFLKILREQRELGNTASLKLLKDLLTDPGTWFSDTRVWWERNSL